MHGQMAELWIKHGRLGSKQHAITRIHFLGLGARGAAVATGARAHDVVAAEGALPLARLEGNIPCARAHTSSPGQYQDPGQAYGAFSNLPYS